MSHQASTSTSRPRCHKQWTSTSGVPSQPRGDFRVGRHSSLKLTKPVHIPIPPSLLQSPHLNPESIFQKPASVPSTPSEADERWLQDTVPVARTKDADGNLSSGSLQATALDSKHFSSATFQSGSRSNTSGSTKIPCSPPLIPLRSQPNDDLDNADVPPRPI
ncbi:hypothetical protein K435DRAFT_853424 [Dendrothele bispora CBS 962.96]|uniref:Uncharacterized protein n=1 Tax=Dendrothele bispora (strain CBS 962.96) TaxID=1314807 RepID=A0A4S8MGD9_DENBC|nr:hypothetical protein K435DRAFT_855796 [Dendrothele bispora CBS 962.96]THV01728.1 hypothetical protein K435DRAFT_853424 [Dendrothele bispora CBS 962.96]